MIDIDHQALNLIKQELNKMQKYNSLLYEYLQNIDYLKLSEHDFYRIYKLFLIYFEGYKNTIYNDATGQRPKSKDKFKGTLTIGIGCNLNIYGKFLPKILNKNPNILNLIYSGEYILSDDEIHAIFIFCIEEHAQILYLKSNSLYFSLWSYFSNSLRLIISSLYFNAGYNLIGKDSKIYKLLYNSQLENSAKIIQLIQHLFNIAKNLKFQNSQTQRYSGLITRRYIEGMILWFNL